MAHRFKSLLCLRRCSATVTGRLPHFSTGIGFNKTRNRLNYISGAMIEAYAAEHNFDLEIIDIYKNPDVAREQHIVFSPSLIKKNPLPKRTLIGTLSDKHKVIKALGISFLEEPHD